MALIPIVTLYIDTDKPHVGVTLVVKDVEGKDPDDVVALHPVLAQGLLMGIQQVLDEGDKNNHVTMGPAPGHTITAVAA